MLIDQRGADGEMLTGLHDEVLGNPEAPGIVRVGPDVRNAIVIEGLEAGGKGLGRPAADLEGEHVEALIAKERLGLVQEGESPAVGARQGVAVLVEAGVGGGIDKAKLALAQWQRHIVEANVHVGFAEAGFVGGAGLGCNIRVEIALGAVADPRHGDFAEGQLEVLHPTAAATHVVVEEVVDVNVAPPIEAVAGPELHLRLRRKHIADGGPGFGHRELGGRAGVVGRVRIVEGKADLGMRDGAGGGAVGPLLGIEGEHAGHIPVLAEEQFAVVLGLIAQAILGERAGGLKADLRTALAVPPVAGADVAADAHKVLQHLLEALLERLVGGREDITV